MRKSEFLTVVFLRNNNIEWFLRLREYKKNPKRLYKQLIEYNTKKTPTGIRRFNQLITEFKTVRSPHEYPELWV